MVISISSEENKGLILETVQEMDMNLFKSIVDNKFSLNSYLKSQIEQMQGINIMIIDLASLSDNDEEILLALDSLRMLYGGVRIIIIAPDCKEGNKLLSEIFALGIYNIISFGVEERDNFLIKRELKQALKEGKTYKDSVRYKEPQAGTEITGKDAKSKQIIEKTIIKREVRQTVNKALIGFAGTMERIGVTNNAILSANYLKDKGYRVAVVESSLNQRKCFQHIQNLYENLDYESDEMFCLNKIDFYKDLPMDELPRIILKNYNFVIIDFGDYSEEIIPEFRRCVLQIIVTGSKAWEMANINKVFEMVEEAERKEYNYLFNFTHLKDKDEIRENMAELNKVYFAGYAPDPYNPDYYPDMDKVFKDYLSTTEIQEPRKPFIRGMIEKLEIFNESKKRKA